MLVGLLLTLLDHVFNVRIKDELERVFRLVSIDETVMEPHLVRVVSPFFGESWGQFLGIPQFLFYGVVDRLSGFASEAYRGYRGFTKPSEGLARPPECP